jgi:hypothetical protein
MLYNIYSATLHSYYVDKNILNKGAAAACNLTVEDFTPFGANTT